MALVRELPWIANADGHPFPPEEAVRRTLQTLGARPE